MVDTKRKTPSIVIEQIRAAILDGFYQPGERLLEAEVAAEFKVSRSPVREALQALESEGTLFSTPYAGALVRPLSSAEIIEIAEIRLSLIALAIRPAYRHLASADFDLAHDLAKRVTRTKNAKEAFECTRNFWGIIFGKAERPILWEMFRKLDDRMTRYYALLLELRDPAVRQAHRLGRRCSGCTRSTNRGKKSLPSIFTCAKRRKSPVLFERK